MREEWLDDEALSAAVGDWQADEEFDAYRTELMLDQAATGRVAPTGDDAMLFALVEVFKPKSGLRAQARQQAFDAMTAEADRRSEEQQKAGGDGQAAS